MVSENTTSWGLRAVPKRELSKVLGFKEDWTKRQVTPSYDQVAALLRLRPIFDVPHVRRIQTAFINEIPERFKSSKSWSTIEDDIHELMTLSSQRGWDGYEAAPINSKTADEALAFLRSLPGHLPRPDVVPEPDGSVGLQWTMGSGATAVVSFSGVGRVSFAAIFENGDKVHGTEASVSTVASFTSWILGTRLRK